MGAVWEIAVIALGIVFSAGINLALTAWYLGKREGSQAQEIAALKKFQRETEAGKTREMNQTLRIFQAIEQLRRFHKTGNGGAEWTNLVGGE